VRYGPTIVKNNTGHRHEDEMFIIVLYASFFVASFCARQAHPSCPRFRTISRSGPVFGFLGDIKLFPLKCCFDFLPALTVVFDINLVQRVFPNFFDVFHLSVKLMMSVALVDRWITRRTAAGGTMTPAVGQTLQIHVALCSSPLANTTRPPWTEPLAADDAGRRSTLPVLIIHIHRVVEIRQTEVKHQAWAMINT